MAHVLYIAPINNVHIICICHSVGFLIVLDFRACMHSIRHTGLPDPVTQLKSPLQSASGEQPQKIGAYWRWHLDEREDKVM